MHREMKATAAAEFRAHWRMLLGCLIGIAVGVASLPYYTTGMFVGPLSQEFGWSRGAAASSALALTLGMALASPFAGRVIDRFGVRRIACGSLVCVAAGFFALAAMPASLIFFYVTILSMAILGIGSAAIGYTRLVNQRFERARGLAIGIVLTGTGVGAVFGPKMVAWAIGQSGWRAAYAVLGGVALSAIPFVLFLLPRDSVKSSSLSTAGDHAPSLDSRSLQETRLIRYLTAIFTVTALGFGGMMVHLVPILTDAGNTLERAASYASLTGFSVIVGRLLIGWLIDRIFAPYVASAVFTLTALGCLLLLSGTWAAPVAAIVLGLAMGAEVDLVGYLVARYFGMNKYGRIYGRLYAAFLLGLGISSALTGVIYDRTGTYMIAQCAAAGLLLSAAVMLLRLPRFPQLASQPASQPASPATETELDAPAAAPAVRLAPSSSGS